MAQPAPAASQRPAPTTSLSRPIAKHPQSRDIIQGFTVVHPSGLPLARGSRMEREPSGFPPSSAPCRYQQRTSGRGLIDRTLIRNYTLDLIEPPTVKLSHCVRPRVALPPCGVPVSAASLSPASVRMPDFRNALMSARTRLSPTRRRTRFIRAGWSDGVEAGRDVSTGEGTGCPRHVPDHRGKRFGEDLRAQPPNLTSVPPLRLVFEAGRVE